MEMIYYIQPIHSMVVIQTKRELSYLPQFQHKILPISMHTSVISIHRHTRIYATISPQIIPIVAVSLRIKFHKLFWSSSSGDHRCHLIVATVISLQYIKILFSISVCEEKTLLEQEAHSQIRNVILGIFFLSLLFVGIGQTAVSTLGIPYIDDNVASKESAVYIGNTRK